jgi:hypothetical protein
MAFDGGPPDSGVDVSRWKEKKFPPGSHARKQFEHLCLLGCDPRGLLSFLTIAVHTSIEQKSIYDIHRVSPSAIRKLPERLDDISRELDAVNPLLKNYVSALAENRDRSDKIRSILRQRMAHYESTPRLLRALALDLRAANAWVGKVFGPKRYDSFRCMVLELLKYVDTCTKSPHYEAVADLLSHLSSAEQKTLQSVGEFLPKPKRTGARKKKGATSGKLLTSPDALKALYLRSAKYHFRDA